MDTPTAIEIYDVTGKKVVSSFYQERLNTGTLSSSLYLVKFTFKGGKNLTKKVLKK